MLCWYQNKSIMDWHLLAYSSDYLGYRRRPLFFRYYTFPLYFFSRLFNRARSLPTQTLQDRDLVSNCLVFFCGEYDFKWYFPYSELFSFLCENNNVKTWSNLVFLVVWSAAQVICVCICISICIQVLALVGCWHLGNLWTVCQLSPLSRQMENWKFHPKKRQLKKKIPKPWYTRPCKTNLGN